MTEKLKPCPFCGGEARLFFTEETGFWDVQCQDCGAEPYLRSKDYEAAAAWNGRRNLVCRNFGGEEGTVGEGYDFACGFCCDLPDARYCPSCGAKVVGE